MSTCRGKSKVQDSFASRLHELLDVLPKFQTAASPLVGTSRSIENVAYPLGGQYQDALEPISSACASPRVVIRLASLKCALSAALQDVDATLQPRRSYESLESSYSIYGNEDAAPSENLTGSPRNQSSTTWTRQQSFRTEWQLKRKLSMMSVGSDEAGTNYTLDLKSDVRCVAYGGSPTGSSRKPASRKRALARPLPFLDVGEDCAIHRWAKEYSIPFAAVSLGTSYFMRLAKVDPILNEEAKASPNYAALMKELGLDPCLRGYPVIGESIGFDVHGQQGMETWLMAVHLGCAHLASHVIGTVREAGTLAQMLTDLHGTEVTVDQASQLEHQIMVAIQKASDLPPVEPTRCPFSLKEGEF